MLDSSLTNPVTFYRITVGAMWFDVCSTCHTISVDNPAHKKWHADIVRAIEAKKR